MHGTGVKIIRFRVFLMVPKISVLKMEINFFLISNDGLN